MARRERTMVTIVDDLTGEEQKEGTGATVPYSWEGKAYEIDLSDANAAEFHKMMARYVEKSRKVRGVSAASPSAPRVGGDGRRRGGGQSMGRSKEELDEIRTWARANGHTVADSGIIPKRVLEAWERRELIPTIPDTQATQRPTPTVRPEGKAPGAVPPPAEKKPEPVQTTAGPEFKPPAPEPVSPARRVFGGGRGSDSR